jgi:hypothetical protein
VLFLSPNLSHLTIHLLFLLLGRGQLSRRTFNPELVSSAQTSLEVLTKIYECLVLVSLEALLTNVGLLRSRYVKIFSILLEDLDTALEPVAFFKYN